MFIAASAVGALDNPFYAALDKLLGKNGFDEFVEETCGEFYADRMGRPGLPPGVYFWMVMRRRFGFGTPRGLQGLAAAVAALAGAFSASWAQSAPPLRSHAAFCTRTRRSCAACRLYNRFACGPLLPPPSSVPPYRDIVSIWYAISGSPVHAVRPDPTVAAVGHLCMSGAAFHHPPPRIFPYLTARRWGFSA